MSAKLAKLLVDIEDMAKDQGVMFVRGIMHYEAGRWTVEVGLDDYESPKPPPDLGVHVAENVGTKDIYGGAS